MGKIVKVSGPLVVATGMEEANMADVVRVGEQRLIGEILTMTGGSASIQVYEETSGLGPGAEVVTTGAPLSVELGPGLVENIYDGIQRPLEEIMKTVSYTHLLLLPGQYRPLPEQPAGSAYQHRQLAGPGGDPVDDAGERRCAGLSVRRVW